MTEPTAAMIVIGDEVLSGRTRDANAAHLAQKMTEHGIALREVRFVPDETDEIIAAVLALRAKVGVVFTSGGIGPTHDDITADAVAAAFGVGIDVRADAREILIRHYGDATRLNEARLRMARIPDGAALIDNPVSGAPGFRLGNVHVMAGVPAVFRAMLDSVLPGLQGGPRVLSHSFGLLAKEGDIAGPLKRLAEENADVSFGSYPFFRDGVYGASIVARSSDADRLSAVAPLIRAIAAQLGAPPPDEIPPGEVPPETASPDAP